MEFSQYTDRLKEFTQKKDSEWNIFLDEFRKINPEPELRYVEKRIITRYPVTLNIKFWLAAAAGGGALALSGFRVSERFFAVAGGYNPEINPFFSYGEAMSAVLAVNVTIFALSIAIAYTKGKMSENSQTWGLAVAGLMSAVAGLGQAFNWLGPEWAGFVSFFDLILAFVLGVGATAMEYFSGDLLGVEIVRYFTDKKAEQTEHDRLTAEAETEYQNLTSLAETEYTEQHKQWVRLAKQQFPNWMSQFTKWNEQTERERIVRSNAEPNNRTIRSREGTFSELVRNVLQQNYDGEQRVLSFGELSAVLTEHLSKNGYSEQDASELVLKKKPQISELRTKWMQENNL